MIGSYLERKGTALSKFKMNHASVLDAGLRETSGGSMNLSCKRGEGLAEALLGLRLMCANDVDRDL